MVDEKWIPKLGKHSKQGLIIQDHEGNVTHDGCLERIYEARKLSKNDAVELIEEIAKYIRKGAGDYRAEMLAKPFETYVQQIKRGIDEKTAARNLTNELGITTANTRPKFVDSEIIEEMLRCYVQYIGAESEEVFEPCKNINQSYETVAKKIGVSKSKVINVWKSYKKDIEKQSHEAQEQLKYSSSLCNLVRKPPIGENQ
ncbi:hypothetical protein [Vibrio rotiferianus]|uniref:hypothetical protein n=1 Tax=Vibrio rotiferianus TaxID=190895 RepID=UPI00390B03E9